LPGLISSLARNPKTYNMALDFLVPKGLEG
jgi:hypothetical protein